MDLLSRSWSGPRVLVVEDDPVSAKVMKRLFAAQSIDVDTATNGRVALEMFRHNRYRLVLSDWMMPEMNGVELCKAFRELTGPYTYFLLCSAKGQKDDRMEAYDAGVDDFLTKPLDPQEFYARLTVARRMLRTEDVLQNQNDKLEQTAAKLEETNTSLRLASRRFEELFNGLPVACFTFDEFGNIQEWNRGAKQIFGFDASYVFEKQVWTVLQGGPESPWTPDRINDYFGECRPPTFDWEYTTVDNQTCYLACNIISFRDQRDHPIGAICANIDITERKLAERRVDQQIIEINGYAEQLEEMNRKLNHLAVTDGLTGLWNHRRFQEMLDDTFETSSRSNKPFSLILLDIDHFKKFNDDFGHQTGDEVLRIFADRLRRSMRQHEHPARYGGEEFAIILKDCDEMQSRRAAKRILASFANLNEMGRKITASLGVATLRAGDKITSHELVANADQALYYSKQTGRDRGTHYDDICEKSTRAAA